MLTLALDLATNTGFALGDLSGVKVSGSRRLPSTGDDLFTFARAYREWLTRGIKRHKPDNIVYEQPLLPQTTQLHICRKLYGLAWQTEITAGDLGYIGRVEEIMNNDWIKHFLGAGNVPRKSKERKLAVQNMCRIRGFHFDDEDEADAIGILDYALACQSPAHAIQAGPLFSRVGPQPQPKLSVAEIRAREAGLRRET